MALAGMDPSACLSKHQKVKEAPPAAQNGLAHTRTGAPAAGGGQPGAPPPQVYAMLPLDVVGSDGTFKSANAPWFKQALSLLAASGVHGVAADVWWGAVERSPGHYQWSGYQQLVELVKQAGLKIQMVLSFHACGGNAGDTACITLPPWVLQCGKDDPDLFYTDRPRETIGYRNRECVSIWASDARLLHGRSAYQCYEDLMRAFRQTFDQDLGTTIEEVVVGAGPCGELRYPSYPECNGWRFPGIGEFQCYDRHALASLAQAARAAGHLEWGYGGPHDAGNYNSAPEQTGFFTHSGSWDSPYGRFFLTWYSSCLLRHGERMLEMATRTFAGCQARTVLSQGEGSAASGRVQGQDSPTCVLQQRLSRCGAAETHATMPVPGRPVGVGQAPARDPKHLVGEQQQPQAVKSTQPQLHVGGVCSAVGPPHSLGCCEFSNTPEDSSTSSAEPLPAMSIAASRGVQGPEGMLMTCSSVSSQASVMNTGSGSATLQGTATLLCSSAAIQEDQQDALCDEVPSPFRAAYQVQGAAGPLAVYSLDQLPPTPGSGEVASGMLGLDQQVQRTGSSASSALASTAPSHMSAATTPLAGGSSLLLSQVHAPAPGGLLAGSVSQAAVAMPTSPPPRTSMCGGVSMTLISSSSNCAAGVQRASRGVLDSARSYLPEVPAVGPPLSASHHAAHSASCQSMPSMAAALSPKDTFSNMPPFLGVEADQQVTVSAGSLCISDGAVAGASTSHSPLALYYGGEAAQVPTMLYSVQQPVPSKQQPVPPRGMLSPGGGTLVRDFAPATPSPCADVEAPLAHASSAGSQQSTGTQSHMLPASDAAAPACSGVQQLRALGQSMGHLSISSTSSLCTQELEPPEQVLIPVPHLPANGQSCHLQQAALQQGQVTTAGPCGHEGTGVKGSLRDAAGDLAAGIGAREGGRGQGKLTLSLKIPGVHWWYRTRSHAAELTAGYYNTATRDGYEPLVELCARYGVALTLTCVEMCDGQHPLTASCSPEGLLKQVRCLTARHGVELSGENALPIFLAQGGIDTVAMERVVINTRGWGGAGALHSAHVALLAAAQQQQLERGAAAALHSSSTGPYYSGALQPSLQGVRTLEPVPQPAPVVSYSGCGQRYSAAPTYGLYNGCSTGWAPADPMLTTGPLYLRDGNGSTVQQAVDACSYGTMGRSLSDTGRYLEYCQQYMQYANGALTGGTCSVHTLAGGAWYLQSHTQPAGPGYGPGLGLSSPQPSTQRPYNLHRDISVSSDSASLQQHSPAAGAGVVPPRAASAFGSAVTACGLQTDSYADIKEPLPAMRAFTFLRLVPELLLPAYQTQWLKFMTRMQQQQQQQARAAAAGSEVPL